MIEPIELLECARKRAAQCVTHHHACDCREYALAGEIELLQIQYDSLQKENNKLRTGLDMIMKCAGAPNPVGALHTVIEIAKTALKNKE
jgi:hypothetical protein